MKFLSFIPKTLYRLWNMLCIAVVSTLVITGGMILTVAAAVTLLYGILGLALSFAVLILLNQPSRALRHWAQAWDPDYEASSLVNNATQAAKVAVSNASNGQGDLADIKAAMKGDTPPGNSEWTKQ